jgi:hypothetical protein
MRGAHHVIVYTGVNSHWGTIHIAGKIKHWFFVLLDFWKFILLA